MTAPRPHSQPGTVTPCSCDWATGECQGPIGCQAVAAAIRPTPSDGAREALACLGDNAPCDHFKCSGAACLECEAASRDYDILQARGDLAVENRNYWQEEAERRAARIIELEAELQRRSGVLSESAWRSVETAPRDGSRMLATGGGLGETVDIVSYNDRVGAWDTGNYTLDDRDDEADGYSRPDRWMPLPASSSVSSADRVSQEALDWAAGEANAIEQYKAANPGWESELKPAREVIAAQSHPDCPCKPGKCIYPKCTCPLTSTNLGGDQ